MSLETKTVLLAWELGEGLGHLPPLKAIAAAFRREGARVAFALHDPVLTRAALADIDAPIVPAPFWPTPAWPTTPGGTYADVLTANGYGAAANIRAMVEAWDEIYDLVKPDLLVCEHAPTAALAAFGRMPVAFVGNGFVVPPAGGTEFPPYDPAISATAAQRPVLVAVQEAMSGLGRKSPKTICEPFEGAFHGVYTFPELDTYRHARRAGSVLGPIEPMPPLTEPPTPAKLFAYSAADYPFADQLAQALMDLGPLAGAYFRGAASSRTAILRSRGVTVWDTAPALGEVLPYSGVAFSHGGTGFTNAALAAGRVHIIAPRHLEARLTARRIEALGAGINLGGFDAKRFRDAVRQASQDARMREAALKAGAAAQAFLKTATPLATTMTALTALLT